MVVFFISSDNQMLAFTLFQIHLLDSKRDLNVNIFLRQFKVPTAEIGQLIVDGESDKIGAEKLRGLLKILPEADEVSRQ